jgi:glycosyltransferase involved in cell wall biosynthesis
MKIVHIVCTYPPYKGGMGNSTYHMVNALKKKGFDIDVIIPKYKNKLTKNSHVDLGNNIIQLPTTVEIGNAAVLKGLEKKLEEYDMVHLHYPFFGVDYSILKWKKKFPHKKLILTYHMDPQSSGLKGLIFSVYRKIFWNKVVKVADTIICSSFDYIEHSLAKDVYRKQKNKWVEIPFGVDTNKFTLREPSEKLKKRFGLKHNIPTILFVGGMDPAHYFKGIPILILALERLYKKKIEFQALLVGDGVLKKEFEIMAGKKGLGHMTCFAGKISDEELPLCYNLADIFVLPSINRAEAFGMVLLEAMASGVPVFASDLPGVRSVAKKGGGIFPVGDDEALAKNILNYLLMENEEKKYVQKNIRDVIKKWYTWDFVADELEKIYTQK